MVAVESTEHLAGMLFEAAETDRKLPPAYRLAVKAAWPDTVPDPDLAYGYNDAEVRRGHATAGEVQRYDVMVGWLQRVDADTSKFLWSVAVSAVGRDRGPRFSMLARIMGLHPNTVKRRFDREILNLFARVG